MLPTITPTAELVIFLGNHDNWGPLYANGGYAFGVAASYVRVMWLETEYGIF